MGFAFRRGIAITIPFHWRRITTAVSVASFSLGTAVILRMNAVDPMDTYATSKLCGERCARSFARRFPGTDIYALRIGNVIEPHEYEKDFPEYVNKPETRKRNAWSYVDARDLGQVCDLCIKKSGLGFQVFNATNTTSSLKVPTMQYLKETQPNTPITRELGEYEGPLSNRKAREVLGFKEEHPWHKYVKV